MKRVAAVDIGTNSVRLLVGELDARDGPLTTNDRRMQITRLARGVDASRRLAPEAIERTLAVLRDYGAAIEAHGATRIRATATSAARDAENRDDLFLPAKAALGTELELLSGQEEAQLSFAGATTGLTAPAPYLIVDIGGGSTELVYGTAAPEALCSLDIGCVRITEQWLHSDPPEPEELSNAVAVVRDHLADADRAIPNLRDAQTVVGLAGTVTAVAAVEQGKPYDRDRIHHFRLTHAAVEDVFRTLARESAAERRHNPGLEPERVDVIVGGVIVLATILRTFAFDEVLVSEDDILDGLARSLVQS
jgi:exopolyphosphatase/guanosine-5'-triphosphate,3'-diphosphate pyrophosphatase